MRSIKSNENIDKKEGGSYYIKPTRTTPKSEYVAGKKTTSFGLCGKFTLSDILLQFG